MAESAPTFTVASAPGRLVMAGRIDESARLAELAETVTAGPLVVDLGDVAYINSLGVRDWVMFLRRLAERGVEVTLERCAEPMVLQMNMILDARGHARIASFVAPFACDGCGWEGGRLIVTAEVLPVVEGGGTPEAECPECQGRARFADFVDRYFLFLA